MALDITVQPQPCGAIVRGIDLTQSLSAAQSAVRARESELQAVRSKAMDLVRRTDRDASFTDVNYIIPTFILTQLPLGLIGLLIVGIIMASMLNGSGGESTAEAPAIPTIA